MIGHEAVLDTSLIEDYSNMSVDVQEQLLSMKDVEFEDVPINTTNINQTELKNVVKRSPSRIVGTDADQNAAPKEKKINSKFECSYCDSSFRKERNLKHHIREDHDDEDLDDKSIKFDIEVTRPKRNLNECPECGIDYHIESELKRHMDLRHSDPPNHLVTCEGDDGNKEDDIERLLAQDEDSSETGTDAALIEEIGSIDEIVTNASGADTGGKDNHHDDKGESLTTKEGVSLPTEEGVSLPTEDKGFHDLVSQPTEDDIDQSIKDVEKIIENETAVASDGKSQDEAENFVKENDAGKDENESSVQQRVINEFSPGDEEPMELMGDEIVMDDDAFNLLENAMQVTMSTPDDSDEDDIPLSSRKRKRKPTVEISKKKRGRPSKKRKADEEIQLDGEAVIEDLSSSADEDIVVVDEKNIVEREDTSSEGSESEPEDDDPDFTPNTKNNKRRSKEIAGKRVKRSSRKVNKPIQITPVVEERVKRNGKKSIAKGRTQSSTVDDDDIVVVDEVNILERGDTSSEESESEDDDPDFTLNERTKGRRKDADEHLRRSSRKVKKPIKKSAKVEEKIIAKGRTKVSVVPIESKSALKAIPKSTKVILFSSDKTSTGSNRQNVSQSARNILKDLAKTKPRTSVQLKQKDVVRCGKCNVNFDSKVQLENHNKRNHYYPCGSCNKVFDMKQKLASHDKAAHQSCDVCEDEFSWPEPEHVCYYTKNNIRPVVKV